MELKITLIFLVTLLMGDENHFQKLDIFLKTQSWLLALWGKWVVYKRSFFFFFNIDESHPNNWLEKLTLKTMPEA